MYKPTKEEIEQGYINPPASYRISVIICNVLVAIMIAKIFNSFVPSILSLLILPCILMLVWAFTNPIEKPDD